MQFDFNQKRRSTLGRHPLYSYRTVGQTQPPQTIATANFQKQAFDPGQFQGGKLGTLSGDVVSRFHDHMTTRIVDKSLDIYTYGPEMKAESPRRSKRSSSVHESESSSSASSTAQSPSKGKKRSDSQNRPKELLTVNNVNLNLTINGQAHHTSKYDISAPSKRHPQLVVRRGQHFTIEVDFSRPFDEKYDDLFMIFEIGDMPLKSRGTYVEFSLVAPDKPKKWGARITSTAGNRVTIEIYTPPYCYVGKWNFKFDVVKADGSNLQVFRYENKDPIYVIFNPWCRDDTVYMQDRKLLSEYIMNEFGRLYTGCVSNVTSMPWNFGQFESCVLDVAIYVLDKIGMSWSVRGDAVHVVRKISAMVNPVDDNGVLIGNWSGNYSKGTPPLSWTGSVPILEEYWNHKRSVGYGQCWVSSGVSTTLCRALGIPARSVTNYESAHDSDGSVTLDEYFTAAGEPDNSIPHESLWIFHVWNEAWMARPDLPAGYGGWQAFDSTPQETSDGICSCGPTSLAAIQNGAVYLPYDAAFLFAEVNADRFYWKQNARGVYDCIYMDKKVAGQLLLTKAVDTDAQEDITCFYKYPEGSPEKRAAVLKANQTASTRRDLYKKCPEEVKFKVVQEKNPSWVGTDFQVGLNMRNTGASKRTVNGRVVINSMFYTGISAETLLSVPINTVVQEGEESIENWTVTSEHYIDKLKDCCMLDVFVMVQVLETEQVFCTRQAYALQKPHLSPEPKPEPKVESKPELKPAEPEPNPIELKSIPTPKPKPKEVLTVKNVNLKLTTNGAAHRTNKYDISSPLKPNPILVARRGQPISIEVEFSRPYDEVSDDLKIIFEFGDKPLTSKGTYVEFIFSAEDKPREWGAKITSSEGSRVNIDIFTPPNCFVGKWNFKFDVIKADGSDLQVFRYEHKDPIYIIFNPWCKEDTVYVEDEKLLNEYILNETGKIYVGSKTNINSKPWNFGQFESCVLDVALYILDITEMSWSIRGNPIPVVRKLSAMVNSPDDGGILTGNWSGDYSGGTSPLSWTGSVAILEEYWKSKSPVCFGQCWVFSGVSTTLCRALGIPARSVTNFESAHDTDGSITVDVHFTAAGEPDDRINDDSVWNFHVWNEAWMARPDLPVGYGGWQAFDSTPQETSGGVYCSGPTSVAAIQEGEVNLPYDGPFLFAEVNADRFYWKPNNRGILQCVYIDKKTIGKFISTKAANADVREDLTNNYKYPEGSPEERSAVLKANQVGSTRHDIYKKTVDDVKFKVIQDPQNSWVGASFEVGLSMKNNSAVKQTVSGRIVIRTMFYTGVSAETLKSELFSIILKAGEEKVNNVVVTQDEYDGKLKDCCMLDVTVLAHVEETEQNFSIKENYTLQKPNLSVTAPKTVTLNQEFKVEVSFRNPLNSTLTNCVVTVDGVAQANKFSQGNVEANGTFMTTLPVVPSKLGQQELIIIFNSKQLEDINVATPINVKAN